MVIEACLFEACGVALITSQGNQQHFSVGVRLAKSLSHLVPVSTRPRFLRTGPGRRREALGPAGRAQEAR